MYPHRLEECVSNAYRRVQLLLDHGSFIEIGSSHDGVVAGYGSIDERHVGIFSHDFSVFGGTISKENAAKVCRVMESALTNGHPLIGLNDSAGARIQDGVDSLAGYGSIFKLNVKASGVIPQISVIVGSCAGGAVYSPALTDFIFMVEKTSQMFVTGPDVIKTVTHESISKEELGGSETHATKSGVAQFVYPNENSCLAAVRRLLMYLPSNNCSEPPLVTEKLHLVRSTIEDSIPTNASKPYDMKNVINGIVDGDSFFEVHADYAPNILVGFARLDKRSIGIVGNQPLYFAGCLDIKAAEKGARFVRFCDSFNIPLITFVDTPGFLPGTDQEFDGIIKHGAKLLYAYAEATVPLLTIITRKAYGGAYVVMSSKHIGGDVNVAYPTAQIAVMGAEGAINILHHKKVLPIDERNQLIQEYKETFVTPYRAAERGYIDDVIEPRDTRQYLISSLNMLSNKRGSEQRRKHGNIPL